MLVQDTPYSYTALSNKIIRSVDSKVWSPEYDCSNNSRSKTRQHIARSLDGLYRAAVACTRVRMYAANPVYHKSSLTVAWWMIRHKLAHIAVSWRGHDRSGAWNRVTTRRNNDYPIEYMQMQWHGQSRHFEAGSHLIYPKRTHLASQLSNQRATHMQQ